MDEHNDKVKRLLDGEIDEAEIAADPVLSSLAERIFGLNIEPITPSKPSQSNGLPDVEVVTATAGADPMIEVVPGIEPKQDMPLPDVAPIPKSDEKDSSGFVFKSFGLTALFAAIGNIFGLFGGLNTLCEAEKCTSDATRLNWIDLHNITNEQGWSMPYPEIGIPDYVAVICSLIVIIMAFRKK